MPSGPSGSTDVLIVGGGPAGLTAALYLARFRRRVRVVDGGVSRLQRIARSRNVPGRADGISGPELLEEFRRHAGQYPVRFEQGRVLSLEKTEDGFVGETERGRFAARQVLLATGATDVEPPFGDAGPALQAGALRYCPVCDGYEAIGRRVGVLGDGPHGAREAIGLRHYSPRVTLFLLPSSAPLSAEEQNSLGERGIALAEGRVEDIRHWDGVVTVRHGLGETDCDVLYAALGMRVQSDLARELGARCDEEGYLWTDAHQCTTVAGLYAAGDVSRGLNQISVACGEAAIAASAIHRALGHVARPAAQTFQRLPNL